MRGGILLIIVTAGIGLLSLAKLTPLTGQLSIAQTPSNALPSQQAKSSSSPAGSTPGVTASPTRFASADSDSTPLISAFNGRPGRAFVLEAWARPEKGGRFYASRFVDACHGVRLSTGALETAQALFTGEDSNGEYLKRVDAFQRLRSWCSDFTEQEFSDYSGNKLLRAPDGDPLARAVANFIAARRDAKMRAAAVLNIVGSRDPVALDDVGMQLSLHGDTPSQAYFYFKGQKYPLKESDDISAAFYLLPCGLGLDCSNNRDIELNVRCVAGTGCFSSRFERAEKELASGDSKKYQSIVAWYQRFVAAIKNGDTRAFVDP